MSYEAAFDWVKRDRADLAVIDCGSRIKLGLELLREIKNVSPDTIVLVITEKSSEEMAIEAFHSGARAYLHKPVNATELQGVVRGFLRLKRKTREKRSPYRYHGKISQDAASEIWSGEPARLFQVVRYIEENLTKSIDLNILARKSNLSKFYFCRLFKRHFGVSPMYFVRLLRVNRAKDMLNRNDFNITEVALNVGFRDHGSFIKAFRKFTGLAPREYRRRFKSCRGPSPGNQAPNRPYSPATRKISKKSNFRQIKSN